MLRIVEAIDWNNLVACVFLCGLPAVFNVLVWRKSPLVNSWPRILAVIAEITVFGWAVVVLTVFCGEAPDNGFAYVCALLFGWAYIWVIGIPILLCAFLLRCAFGFGWWMRERIAKRRIERGKPMWGVAILVVLSVVVLPIFLSVKPDRIWQEWNGRQYRTMVEGGIVHVQVHENGKDADVRTDASAVMRYHLKSISDDELQLKSSDVGFRFIGKFDGRWRCYYLQDGEKVFCDGE